MASVQRYALGKSPYDPAADRFNGPSKSWGGIYDNLATNRFVMPAALYALSQGVASLLPRKGVSWWCKFWHVYYAERGRVECHCCEGKDVITSFVNGKKGAAGVLAVLYYVKDVTIGTARLAVTLFHDLFKAKSPYFAHVHRVISAS